MKINWIILLCGPILSFNAFCEDKGHWDCQIIRNINRDKKPTTILNFILPEGDLVDGVPFYLEKEDSLKPHLKKPVQIELNKIGKEYIKFSVESSEWKLNNPPTLKTIKPTEDFALEHVQELKRDSIGHLTLTYKLNCPWKK